MGPKTSSQGPERLWPTDRTWLNAELCRLETREYGEMSGNRSKIRFAPFGFAKFQCISIDGCAALRAQSPRHICTLLRATALLLTSFFAVKPAEFSVILLQRQVEKVIEDRLNRILSIAIERNALNAEICISCISYYKCHEHLSRTRPSGIYAVNLPLSSTLIRKKKL